MEKRRDLTVFYGWLIHPLLLSYDFYLYKLFLDGYYSRVYNLHYEFSSGNKSGFTLLMSRAGLIYAAPV